MKFDSLLDVDKPVGWLMNHLLPDLYITLAAFVATAATDARAWSALQAYHAKVESQ